MVDFVEQVIEIEFALPVGIIVTRRPLVDEFVLDTVIGLNVVDHLDDTLIDGLVKIDVR